MWLRSSPITVLARAGVSIITHAVSETRLLETKAAMETAFPEAAIECYALTPAFITQGGPNCVAIQVVKEI